MLTRGEPATSAIETRGLLLFVPANRPERFVRAACSGADGIVIDLEDAVPAAQKDSVRAGLGRSLANVDVSKIPVFVRINAVGTPWHAQDVEAISHLPIWGVMLPKAERASDIRRLVGVFGDRKRVIALVETARGVASARSLARAAGRLAFGSIDFAADLGCGHTREALLFARSELVLASRLAGLSGLIDGVTVAFDAPAQVEAEAAYAATLGCGGKLLIHPNQVAAAARGFRPPPEEIAWAERVLANSSDGNAVTVVDGTMVDRPVRLRAEQVLRKAALAGGAEREG